MEILAVVPARYESQRFPGKVLAKLGDRPMVQWVYEATKSCPAFTKVLVATDSEKVADCVRGFGGEVAITRSDHRTGTDRVAEVAQRYPDMQVVVNVQGDQPFVTAEMLTSLIQPYLDGATPEMTTLGCPLDLVDIETDYSDPNVVKVITDRQGNALYFSRSPIPYRRNPAQIATLPVFHHLGLYAFRQDFLSKYAKLAPTPLEQCEGLEQLRVLEHGYRIVVCHTAQSVLEVNTPAEMQRAQAMIANT
ncbi:3-deoxy-manno-octulosonate cytidylyltransferase [Thalassoporum mexicanum PCC 7367]|uniref:3-deoxy-manno-octulosonate cytidylyltransferase n=1 Tax=Thalassoporum mexicanum TaxID=3457544 RepID=UPI00029F8F5E|nr:3-deoxy-manno-octulosonate cytidylyltransferase [Pseudanabaena sp. PCC 7367]AFY68388.1 3-deoxy-manno-octulosonate cytidylyltransferase [Pseudanabaena sp. PCC 7367]